MLADFLDNTFLTLRAGDGFAITPNDSVDLAKDAAGIYVGVTGNVKLITAAGGIVEKRTPDGIKIALVYRELYGSEWALPKGKQEKGESLEQTALREVEEETGCAARIIEYGGCIRYYHGKSPKKVSKKRSKINFRPSRCWQSYTAK